jgi:hypothetical protein
VLIGTTKNVNIYIYPVLSQTTCPDSIAPNGAALSCDLNSGGGCTCSPSRTATSCAGIADNPPQTACDAAGDCCNTPQVLVHVQYSAPDTVTNFAFAADATANVEWYQPVHEPLNVLSYPWTQAQVQSQVDTAATPLTGPNTFAIDTSAKTIQVNWSGGGSQEKSVGSTSNFSFETDNTITVGTPSIEELAEGSGGQVSGSYSYNTSTAHSSLNTSQMTLTESQGVTVTAPGFTDVGHVSLYSYGVSPEIFLQTPSLGVIQNLPPGCGKDDTSLCDLPVSGLGAGSLRVQHSVDITTGGSWWATGPYSRASGLPDVALNHPARWRIVTGQGPACVTFKKQDEFSDTDCVQSIPPKSAADLKNDSRLLWSSEWYFMRGLLVTVDTPQGPQRDTATTGDTVYLRARVYNYSQKAMPTGTQVHVQFYRQQIDPSTYALIGNSVLIEDVLLAPIPPHSNPIDNPDDLPNWVFAETSFDTTTLATIGPTSWLFWVVTWGERDGAIIEEVAGHGLDLTTAPTEPYTSIADVPLQLVSVTDPASGNPMTTSFTNNVGFYHKVFTILPTTVALALPTAARAPELRVRDLRVKRDVNDAGHRRLVIEAEVLSIGDHTNGVVIRFYEGDPGKKFDRPAVDEEILGHLRPDVPHRVQVPYRPRTCGVPQEIVMVVAPGQKRETRASVVAPWVWPGPRGGHVNSCAE